MLQIAISALALAIAGKDAWKALLANQFFSLGALLFYVLVSLVLASFVWIIRSNRANNAAVVPDAGVRIEILSPLSNGVNGVNRIHEIIGSAWPPNSSVQVVIKAGGKWYGQDHPVTFTGAMWSTKAYFGDPQSGPGGPYIIIAKLGGAHISGSLWDLPKDGRYSREVKVMRVEQSSLT